MRECAAQGVWQKIKRRSYEKIYHSMRFELFAFSWVQSRRRSTAVQGATKRSKHGLRKSIYEDCFAAGIDSNKTPSHSTARQNHQHHLHPFLTPPSFSPHRS